MRKIIILSISFILFALSILGIRIFNTKDTFLLNKLENIKYNFNNKNYFLDKNRYIDNKKILNNYDYFSTLNNEEKKELFERFVNTNINYKLKTRSIKIIKDINNSKFYLVNFKPIGYAIFKYETLEVVEIDYNKNLVINAEKYIYSPFGKIEKMK